MEILKQYEILDNDYKRKCEQSHNHLVSLFTRFNYFLALEGLIIAASLIKANESNQLKTPICIIGIATSFLWYCIASNDRYLVKIFRQHTILSFNNLEKFLSNNLPEFSFAQDSVMDISCKEGNPKMNPFGWRLSFLGLTDYFAIFPLMLCLFWILFLVNVF